ncbi:MAG: septum formation initiator family protein [Alphaproteobacteria bacterium]|nr:septum formation initiator family protein [Myxococcales bacterium]MCB9670457.1 septum formation initiator family protein [Alphaproteobacteria bacterium]MCB9694267.1 septum formation initiator family protein [Alphaproteobacteria bacterium]
MRLSPRLLLFTIVPASVLVFAAAIAVWGDNGLLVRHQLRESLASSQADLADLDAENRQLLREMRTMRQDPVVLERMVADELKWGREGDVIVQFDE